MFIVIAELCAALLIGSIILFVYTRKLKALIKKQQAKLLNLVAELKDSVRDAQSPGVDPAEHERELEACKKRAENAAAALINEKEALIQDLQQQLASNASASEDSESSVQILKEELIKTQEELTQVQEELTKAQQELALAAQTPDSDQPSEEQQHLAAAVENLTQENQQLAARLSQLNAEYDELKQAAATATVAPAETLAGESTPEQDAMIAELQEQLQRQIRSTQEAETCVQVLSKELLRGNEAIAREETMLAAQTLLGEENQQLKANLEELTQDSKDLQLKLGALEGENTQLKQDLGAAALAAADSDKVALAQQNQQQEILEKNSLILELQEQAQAASAQLAEAEKRAQELDTRAQLLDNELASAQKNLLKGEQAAAEQAAVTAENHQLKQTLADLDQQRQNLQDTLAALETEIGDLRNNSAPSLSVATTPAATADLEQQALIQQLRAQIEQQTSTAQASEALAQALRKELLDLKKALQEHEKAAKSHEKALKEQEKALKAQDKVLKEQEQALQEERSAANEVALQENQSLREALEKLTQEHQDLAAKLSLLESENAALKEDSSQTASSPSASDALKYKKLQAQYKDLQIEFAELEEKYIELTNL